MVLFVWILPVGDRLRHVIHNPSGEAAHLLEKRAHIFVTCADPLVVEGTSFLEQAE